MKIPSGGIWKLFLYKLKIQAENFCPKKNKNFFFQNFDVMYRHQYWSDFDLQNF